VTKGGDLAVSIHLTVWTADNSMLYYKWLASISLTAAMENKVHLNLQALQSWINTSLPFSMH